MVVGYRVVEDREPCGGRKRAKVHQLVLHLPQHRDCRSPTTACLRSRPRLLLVLRVLLRAILLVVAVVAALAAVLVLLAAQVVLAAKVLVQTRLLPSQLAECRPRWRQ